jgi:hypothetical protein
MEFPSSWMKPEDEGSVHEAMHECQAHTPDPTKYHKVAKGTMIPHLPPGQSGAGSSGVFGGADAIKVEGMVGDGASPAFNPNVPNSRINIHILDDVRTGAETKLAVDNPADFFREDKIQAAVASTRDVAERIKRLMEMQEDVPSEVRGPSPNAAFEQILMTPVLQAPALMHGMRSPDLLITCSWRFRGNSPPKGAGVPNEG